MVRKERAEVLKSKATLFFFLKNEISELNLMSLKQASNSKMLKNKYIDRSPAKFFLAMK